MLFCAVSKGLPERLVTSEGALTLGGLGPHLYRVAAPALILSDNILAAPAKYGVIGLQYTWFRMFLVERQLAVGTGSLPVLAAASLGAR